ncbi:MAG: bifunctional methylenetetrahydrofolate dehydrogenase/methenyltetrahydrofolate cyclohydrolase FolD [Clostridia bacterium]|nr:bifunctional methylenetetrahydrofolate dehydrogenase/methenyltetrahydrofolate cyclohydrolase FolD [Clostridia bacterium]
MILLDGKQTAKDVRAKVRDEAALAVAKYGDPICLAVILVGEDPASKVYVNNKIKGCAEVGFESRKVVLPETASQEEVLAVIKELNADPSVNGVLLQLPLPKGLDEQALLAAIDPNKDVDGLHIVQRGRLFCGLDCLLPCTPYGIMQLLETYGIDPKGKRAVVIGRSNLVGKPLAMLLLNANATVTICHSRTVDLPSVTREADILVAAVGKANFVTEDMVKEGAVVIDVGINRVDGKLVGDVDFESVAPHCSYITPVPGGVGPMTVTMLLANTLSAYKTQHTR